MANTGKDCARFRGLVGTSLAKQVLVVLLMVSNVIMREKSRDAKRISYPGAFLLLVECHAGLGQRCLQEQHGQSI